MLRAGLSFLALASLASALEAQSAPIAWQPLSSRTYDGRPITGEAGKLQVPESRARPGRTITLGLIRLPSTSATPGDPTVFLMGGPGIPASVMLPVPPYFTLFERLRAVGDVILVDQRGIGQSEPVLTCPATAPLPFDFLASFQRAVETLREVTRLCVTEWRGKGIDIHAYNTQESSDDLESLRQAIGAQRLNLLAFSYGTHLALSYARRYPGATGRMVLQGVRGPDQSLKSPAVYERIFRRLSELAGKDSVVSKLIATTAPRGVAPHLDLLLASRLALLEAMERQEVAYPGPEGSSVPLSIGREGLALLVSTAIDDPRIPAMLASWNQQDFTLLATMAGAAWQGLAEVNLMARAMDCASGRSVAALERVKREAPGALLGNPAPNLVRMPEYCGVFADIHLPNEFRSPITSAAPTLFISGDLDAQAPVEDATEVAAGFSNRVELTVTNGRHELLPIGAVQDAVVDFLAGKDVAGRRLTADPPRWFGIEEAKAPPRRR